MSSFKALISSFLSTTFSWLRKGTAAVAPPPLLCSNAGDIDDKVSTVCAVCLSSLDDQGGTKVLPCRHEFHATCIDSWLSVPHAKNTCPVCRFSMRDEDCGGSSNGKSSFKRQECFTEEMVIWFSSFHVAGF